MEDNEAKSKPYLPQVYFVPVDLLGIALAHTIQFPPYYEGIYEIGLIVPRFDFELYWGIIRDNVTAHLFRGSILISLLDIPNGINRELILRTFMQHDNPEVWLREDTPVIIKGDDKRDSELQIAMERLRSDDVNGISDKKIYLLYTQANEFLRSESITNPHVPIEYIIVRIIDIVESNMLWHFCVTSWIQSDNFEPRRLKPLSELALPFTFNTFRNIQMKLQFLKDHALEFHISPEHIDFCFAILDHQISYIAGLWDKIYINSIRDDLDYDIEGNIMKCMQSVNQQRVNNVFKNIYVI